MQVSIMNRVRRKAYHVTHRSYRLPRFTDERRRLYLFDTVEHGNYGDHAITVAELDFFARLPQPWQVVPIRGSQVVSAIGVVKTVIRPQDIVVYHGGGNMGDIWVAHEQRRQAVMAAFHEYKIISMPQSTSYQDDGQTLQDAIRIMRTCQDLTVFARDAVSYAYMQTHFPANVQCHLVPDIVLSLRDVRRSQRRQGVTTFLRRDQERQANPRLIALVQSLNAQTAVTASDTVDSKRVYISPRMRTGLLEKKLEQFRSSQLIVTDRLHGAIFATITGTPAIVFDNNNHKIKYSFSAWLGQIGYVRFADKLSDEQLHVFAEEALAGKLSVKVPNFDADFATLKAVFQ